MKHEPIKKAVLSANLPDADVALRTLDRIDKDEAFRDALIAVVDTGDDDALQNVIYSHFTPVKHRHGDFRVRDKSALRVEPLNVTISSEEVVKLVNDHALEVLVNLLSTDAIEKRLVRFVEQHMEAIVLGIIGLEKDSYRGYRTNGTNGRHGPVENAIQARIKEKTLPILMAALDVIDLDEIANDVVTRAGGKELKEFYTRAVRQLMRDTASTRAQEYARVHVEELMRDYFDAGEEG